MKPMFYLSILISITILNCSSPANSENNAPVIEEIILNDVEVFTNSSVTLTAIAIDKDGDDLTYFWSASSGNIAVGYILENPTTWGTPDNPGQYTVTCTVSDGKDTDSKSISITVQ